ncbi:eukaryotic translation initiation factor 5A [Vairimorpha necatrix]|uniref:Eukaryotic translation initiation factor 5A n=1 Tax=Vairimorpha necatrix TaxID=6039 RepID=A0AAX4JEP3_9MICR
MAEFLKFQEEGLDRKEIKVGHYIKIEENDTVKFTRVEKIDSVKCGKHGSAKTAVTSKDLPNNTSRNMILVASDRVTVMKMIKVNAKLIDFTDDKTITVKDENNNYLELDVEKSMSQEDKDKINEVMEENGDVEEFDFVFRALPGYIKIDTIRPSK